MKKRIVGMLLAVILVITIIPISVMAARIDDDDVFVAQTGSECTVAASVMMLRRAAILAGNADWNSITIDSVMPVAWINGTGIRWTFSYAGFNVKHGTLPDDLTEKTNFLSQYLENHREGIVVYNPEFSDCEIGGKTNSHAILLTDYQNGVFYCGDSGNKNETGRRPVSECTMRRHLGTSDQATIMAGFKTFWYIENSPTCQHQYTTENADCTDTADGYKREYCTVCGDVNSYETIHNWDEGKIIKQETKTDDVGLTTVSMLYKYTCKNCKQEMTRQKFHFYGKDYTGPDWKEMTWGIISNSKDRCLEIVGEISDGLKELKDLVGDINSDFWALVAGNSEVSELKLHNMKIIPDNFFSALSVSKADLSGVTSIGKYAFAGCPLESILLPSTLQNLGEYAFKDCTQLRTVRSNVMNIVNCAASAFSGCSNISTLQIPYGVTKIADGAYAGKTNLTSVIIPSTVTSIGSNAFSSCTNLQSVTIPDGVTSIGSRAFSGCTNLQSITIPDSVKGIAPGAFYSCANLRKITLPITAGINFDTSYNNEEAFQNCSGIEEVVFTAGSDGMPGNGADAYYDKLFSYSRSKLKSVVFEEGVQIIPYGICYECSALTTADIPSTVKKISKRAFSGCANLQNVTIPDSVTEIGESAFAYCKSLTSLNLPKGITRIELSTFLECSGISGEVIIPDGVTSIGSRAFSGCTNLQSITIPDSVKGIAPGAFYSCANLRKITLPITAGINFDTSYNNEEAFQNCSGIEEVVFTAGSNGMPGNGADAYYDKLFSYSRSKLKSVVFEEGVQIIPYDICYECSALTTVDIPSTVTKISKRAFAGCTNLQSVTIPDNVTEIGESAFANCKSLTSLKLPKGITQIGECTFSACTNLQSVTIPDSVTSIGQRAFGDCRNLKKLKMPITANISLYKDNYNYTSFYNCNNLEEVVFTAGSDGTPGNGAGYNYDNLFCYSLKTLKKVSFEEGVKTIPISICYNCEALTTVDIPSTVTSIVSSAFRGCTSLEKVTIPDSVTEIGNSAFAYCNKITDVYYSGTEEQWKQISIQSNNDPLLNATIHFTGSLPGDVTGDGSVDVMDLISLKKCIAEGTSTTTQNMDINGDGVVNVLDLICLKKLIAGA